MTRLLQPYQLKPRYVPKSIKHEETLQLQCCRFLDLQYPNAIYRSDYASGLHLTEYQAKKHKAMQSSRSFPDLFIFEPRVVNGVQYAGLGIELKKDGTTIIIKIGANKGHLTANPHIREQVLMLKQLKARGYYTTIAVGFDEFVKTVNWYFGKSSLQNAELF